MKHLKWSFIVLFALGLSACYLDEPFNGNPSDQAAQQAPVAKKGHTTEAKTTGVSERVSGAERVSSGSGPAQKIMPGPKRAAAPQIPVVLTE